MPKEESPQNNTKRISNRYTPEEEKEFEDMANEYVTSLNSARD